MEEEYFIGLFEFEESSYVSRVGDDVFFGHGGEYLSCGGEVLCSEGAGQVGVVGYQVWWVGGEEHFVQEFGGFGEVFGFGVAFHLDGVDVGVGGVYGGYEFVRFFDFI